MSREIELWQFMADRLSAGERVVLLVVAESHGSSPGRAGYKMAVAENGDLIGSIGGGVMEVNLVDQARAVLSGSSLTNGVLTTRLIEQEHRKNSEHPSGMICSGRQMVLQRVVSPNDRQTIESAILALTERRSSTLGITESTLTVTTTKDATQNPSVVFQRASDVGLTYAERLGSKNELILIGGGHCALALTDLMSRMDFSIRIFDDRPELNTLEKNDFADEITIIDSYLTIADHIASADNAYIVVMTLGFRTDAVVIRQLLGKRFKYFGVLGSKAKMTTLLRELAAEGYPKEQLDSIRTPIGVQINSHTPEEIAVSIAAEIISVKNA